MFKFTFGQRILTVMNTESRSLLVEHNDLDLNTDVQRC